MFRKAIRYIMQLQIQIYAQITGVRPVLGDRVLLRVIASFVPVHVLSFIYMKTVGKQPYSTLQFVHYGEMPKAEHAMRSYPQLNSMLSAIGFLESLGTERV